MNKDTIIGFVLIAVVLIGFSWWNQPSAEQIESARKQDSIAAVMKEQAAKAQQEAAKVWPTVQLSTMLLPTPRRSSMLP